MHFWPTGKNPAAPGAFDDGLFFYYAYDHEASYRAFERATAYEPGRAMAYWGMALASGPDLNTPMTAAQFGKGAAAIAKAQTLDAGVTPEEHRFISAMSRRYKGTFAQWNGDDAAYRAAMSQFARDSANETAKMLAAEALLEAGGLDWQSGSLANPDSRQAFALVNDVLRTNASNLMANHLCIHLYDFAPERGAALPCAQRLDATKFPPEAEHLAHMPAHYWIETGNYRAAQASSERAVALSNELQASRSAPQYASRYHKHDVAVGYAAAMMLGSYADARRWADRMAGAFDTSFYALTALRFGRYADAYRAADAGFAAQTIKGWAALRLGRVQEAQSMGHALPKDIVEKNYLAQLFLAALAEANGDLPSARSWVARARTAQHADFRGELLPAIPAGEALGALELRHGNAQGAIDAFSQTLHDYPNDPRALFGLSAAYQAADRASEAAATRAQFARQWKGADTIAPDALL
ncbi:MAG: hypothetical protein JO311_07890 [Candidatus Eremiobacteraeota bacterium]|nr:hypothetical protein [Candidatus Eremiobacteraeota bacterium]